MPTTQPPESITEPHIPTPIGIDGLSVANPTPVPRRRDAIRSAIVLGVVLVIAILIIAALVIYYHGLNPTDLSNIPSSSSSTTSTSSSNSSLAKLSATEVLAETPIYYSYGDSMYQVTGQSDPVKVGPGGQISPDNTQIVYNKSGSGSNGDQDSQFILYDIASKQETVITNNAFNYDGQSNNGWPKFSPNGRYVYSIFSTSPESDLRVYDLDTHLLAYSDTVWFDKVAWDGDMIIYATPTDNLEAARPFGSGHSGSIATYDLKTGPKKILVSSTATKDYGLPDRSASAAIDLPHKVYITEVNYIIDPANPLSYANYTSELKILDVVTGDLITPDATNPIIQIESIVHSTHPDDVIYTTKLNPTHPGWYLVGFVTPDNKKIYYVVNLDDVLGTLTSVSLDTQNQDIVSANW